MYTYDSTSQAIPGYRFQYQVPPTSAALSISRMLPHTEFPEPGPGEQSAEPGADDRDVDLVGQWAAGESRIAPGVLGESSKWAGDLDVLRDAVIA